MMLRRKILIGYGLTLAITVLVLSWAVTNLVRLGRASEAILQENYRSILAAGHMIDSIERQDSATLLLMLDYTDEGVRQFYDNEARFLLWLGRAKDNITIEGEPEILSAIESGYREYLVTFAELRERRRTDPGQAGAFYHEAVLPNFSSVRDRCLELRDLNQATMSAASRRAEKVARAAILSTAIIGMGAVVVGLAFSLLLSKRLVRPIRQMTAATRAVAEGDYDVELPAGGPGELGTLAEGFNAMAKKLGAYHRLNIEKIVAERRKSEAVLRSIEDGIVVIDAEFRMANINPPAAEMLDLDASQVQGKHFLEVVRDETLFDYVKAAAESGESPGIEPGQNILTIERDGSPRHYMFSVTPIASEASAMAGVVLLLRDVTRLKELDRMKSEFVMAASHELKTPLQSLSMSVDLLDENAGAKLDEKERQLLGAAREELGRLKSLIHDLLDLSKIESGRVEMEFDRTPVPVLVDKALEVFATQIEEKKLKLSSEVPEDLPDVQVDPNKITWVLTNLIANALRYAEGRISISAGHSGEWVRLSVADDGAGIAPEDQSRIFDKFVRVKTDQAPGGTGLGLAICKEIVHAHKGTIWVDSSSEGGSTFSFTMPVAQKT